MTDAPLCVVTYQNPADFCDRHKTISLVRRCCHLGNRFVIEMRRGDEAYRTVDFVEDLPDGGVLVEADCCWDEQQAQVIWDWQVERLKNGETPVPERGS